MFSCLMMTGIIWLIQIVHYPSFAFISKQKFISFERFHQKKISILVIPLMSCEFISHFLSYTLGDFNFSLRSILPTLALLAIWFVTFFMCVPCHNKLCNCFDHGILKKLIFYNYFRTFFWSLRSCFFFLEQLY